MLRSFYFALLLAACEPPASVATTPPAQPLPEHEHHGHPEPTWTVHVLPAAIPEDGEIVDYPLGQVRTDARGNPRVANEVTASPIDGVFRADEGFVFHTRDGSVYRTGGIAGSLHVIALPRRTETLVAIGGAFVGLDESGAVWTFGGRSLLHTTELRTNVMQLAASADAVFVLDVDGTVQRSDGGTSPFVKVPTSACVLALEQSAAGLEARMHAGRELLAPPAPRPTAIDLGDPALAGEHHATLARIGQLVRLVDGTLASRDGDTLVRPDGRAITRAPEDCRLAIAGAHVFARCATNDASQLVAVWKGGTWQTIGIGFEPATIVLGTSGWIAGRGREITTPEAPSRWFRSNGEVTEPLEGKGDMEAVGDDWVVWRDADKRVVRRRSDGAERELAIEGPLRTVEGHVYAKGGDGEHPTLVIGAPLGELAHHPLPGGVGYVAMASPTHGIAAGNDGEQIYTTTDGGKDWSPLVVPRSGDARWVVVTGGAHCTNAACRVGQIAWVDTPTLGDIELTRLRIVAPRDAPQPRGAPPRSSCTDARMDGIATAIQCTGDRCTIDRAWLRARDPAALESAARWVPAKDGTSIRVYGIRAATLFKQLGLKNGDTVTAIDGKPPKSETALLAALTHLRARATLRIDYLRKGERKTLFVAGR